MLSIFALLSEKGLTVPANEKAYCKDVKHINKSMIVIVKTQVNFLTALSSPKHYFILFSKLEIKRLKLLQNECQFIIVITIQWKFVCPNTYSEYHLHFFRLSIDTAYGTTVIEPKLCHI